MQIGACLMDQKPSGSPTTARARAAEDEQPDGDESRGRGTQGEPEPSGRRQRQEDGSKEGSGTRAQEKEGDGARSGTTAHGARHGEAEWSSPRHTTRKRSPQPAATATHQPPPVNRRRDLATMYGDGWSPAASRTGERPAERRTATAQPSRRPRRPDATHGSGGKRSPHGSGVERSPRGNMVEGHAATMYVWRWMEPEPSQPAALLVWYAVNHQHRPAAVERHQLQPVPARSRQQHQRTDSGRTAGNKQERRTAAEDRTEGTAEYGS